MTENGGDLKASRALNVHEKGIRGLYKPLELVGAFFLFGGGVQ